MTDKFVLVMQGIHVVDVLNENGSNCNPFDPGDLCGGCDQCLLMQASHYGCTLRECKGFWKWYEAAYYRLNNIYYWLRREWKRTEFMTEQEELF